MTREPKRRRQRVPEPKKATLPPKDYQPGKAELEEEFDMPGMSFKQMREAFFRPFRFERSE